MGKASKWFRGLLGLKKSDPNPNPTPNQPQKSEPPKRKWSFAKSNKEKAQHGVVPGGRYDDPASKQAMVVAAATARVAEAAVAAAQAAAAAVKHPGSGRSTSAGVSSVGLASVIRSGAGYGSREDWAAVTIQSHFRAYLSRRALRALKSLVKLQALVKGHLVRKQTAFTLRRLQALVRAQTRARQGRVLISGSPNSSMKSSHFNYPGPTTPEKFEHAIRARSMKHEQATMLKRSGSKSNGSVNYDLEKSNAIRRIWMESRTGERPWDHGSFTRIIPTDDERSDKILEVDTGKPPKRKNLFYSSHLSLGPDPTAQTYSDSTARQTVFSASSGEIQSLTPLQFEQDAHVSAYCTAENSPLYYSVSGSRKGSFTPTKSDGSRSCLSGYSDHPNYMAFTESSKAKVRSLSAPKQRPSQYERSGSAKRYSVHGYGESKAGPRVYANFANKAYPGSGRLDRLGMPVGSGGGHWQNKY